jgi:hypothetical protein
LQYKEDYFTGTGNVIGGAFFTEGAASATDLAERRWPLPHVIFYC